MASWESACPEHREKAGCTWAAIGGAEVPLTLPGLADSRGFLEKVTAFAWAERGVRTGQAETAL